jgi:hypothetical protein
MRPGLFATHPGGVPSGHERSDGERAQSVTDEQPAAVEEKRKSNLVSNIFAVAAVAFAVLAAILYFRDYGGGVAPIPTAAPGGNQIVNVTEALKAQGFGIEQPRGLFIPRGVLDAPGQGVEINGVPAFVFLYPDAEAARADAAAADPNAVVPERLAGTPAPTGERRLTRGSNVVVLVVGGDEEMWQKVESAVASLH